VPVTSQPPSLKFGPFSLDLQRGALVANGRNEIPLRPRSFALLRFLVEHSGVLISRETIRKTLWPNVFVVDDNITQCVGDIRRALGAAGSEYLRTVPKRGYIFSGLEKSERAPNGSTEAANLAPARRWITSMFTDLEGYTRLAERLEPEVYAPLLEEYLSQMIAITHRHDGLLLGVMGDGLNVAFGLSTEPTGHAARAVECAFALDNFTERLRARWSARGVRVGVTRIGIHSGPALVGSFGTADGYSAHGETINIASRLEAANRIFGTRICMSSSTFQQVPNLQARVSGEIVLRDGLPAADVYEPILARRSFGSGPGSRSVGVTNQARNARLSKCSLVAATKGTKQ
jgi:class 3 adenylate cyclase